MENKEKKTMKIINKLCKSNTQMKKTKMQLTESLVEFKEDVKKKN